MISPEHLVPHKRSAYKVFNSNADFASEQWVPALRAIHESKTAGQQHTALADALTGYAAYTKTPMSESKDKLTLQRLSAFGFKARFRLVEGAFDLRSAQFGTLQVSYPSQPGIPDSPTFAVIDQENAVQSVHEVIKTPNQMLGYAGQLLSREATFHLAFSFNQLYPGLEIGQQLGLDLSW